MPLTTGTTGSIETEGKGKICQETDGEYETLVGETGTRLKGSRRRRKTEEGLTEERRRLTEDIEEDYWEER